MAFPPGLSSFREEYQVGKGYRVGGVSLGSNIPFSFPFTSLEKSGGGRGVKAVF